MLTTITLGADQLIGLALAAAAFGGALVHLARNPRHDP